MNWICTECNNRIHDEDGFTFVNDEVVCNKCLEENGWVSDYDKEDE